ncbi:TetR/AcrR family transcriptional regulator [Rhodococcus sp. no. 34]
MTPDAVPSRRLPEQQRSKARVEAILDCAAELIARDGIDAMTMSELASAADLRLPSIYRYFPGKTAIVQTLLERYETLVRARLIESIAPAGTVQDAREVISSVVRGYWQIFRDDTTYAAVWSAAVANPDLARIDVENTRQTSALIADVIRGVVPESLQYDVDQLVFTCNHIAGSTVRFATLVDPDEAERIVDMLVDHILPTALGLSGTAKS